MSKKKDRQDIRYRFCPLCGGKRIYVIVRRKFISKKTYIYCTECEKDILVRKEVENGKNT